MKAEHTLTQIEEIVMALSEQQIEKAVRSTLSEQVNSIIDHMRSNAEDELSNIASEVESTIENYVNDAVRNIEIDEDQLEELCKDVTQKLYADLKGMPPEVSEAPAVAPSIETVSKWLQEEKITPSQILTRALAYQLSTEQVNTILEYMAERYETEFATFVFRRLRG